MFSTTFTPRKSKSCGKGDRNWSTRLDSRQVGGGIEKGGLYNRVKPPEDWGSKDIKEKH